MTIIRDGYRMARWKRPHPRHRAGECGPATSFVSLYLRLVIQDRVQERTMNLDLSVIGNEAELAKLVHEKADTGAGCPDHFCERLLADLRLDGLRGAVL